MQLLAGCEFRVVSAGRSADSGQVTSTLLQPAPPSATRLRIARAADRAAVYAFLGRLSGATLRLRYLFALGSFTGPAADREVHRLLRGDEGHVVVVAFDGPDIRGVGEFVVDAETNNEAELALVVEDAFQHRGIGRALYEHLQELARERGISVFTGDVQHDNHRVFELLRGSGRAHVFQDFGSARFTLRVA
jgi:GNAT superfamily N-acetyltransferase